ncbi:MAG: YdcF family protein [Clostridiales bacterium]|nr:YdcF family protein [Clostridiales bacterium]
MKISIKPLLICYAVIIIAMVVSLPVFGDVYSMYNPRISPETDKLEVNLEPEGIVEVKEIRETKENYQVFFKALKPGNVFAEIRYYADKDNPNKFMQIRGATLIVTKPHIILNEDVDFGGNQYTLMGLALLFLVTTIHFTRCYLVRRKHDFFAYRTILDIGLALYFFIMTAVFGGVNILYLLRPDLLNASLFFDYAGNALSLVVLATVPLILIFACFMGFSNLRLIMKEGFRPVNLLGIFIGVFMIVAAATCFYLLEYSPFLVDESKMGVALFLAKTAFASAFLYFECILLASTVCLQRAGRFNPTYNKDYIIILGCAIKKDGTLYPLIRGRVDRAIKFYKDQLEATGKKAVFVPSGGQGSDEIISEGEAMKRYLLEQGIEESQIMAETRSTTTLENMKFSQELISQEKPNAKVAFSTTNYHVFRGGMFAREAGMHASGMGAKTKWYFWPNAEVREFVGLIVNEIWVHIGVVFGLVAISVFMANLGTIMKFLL